MKYMLFYDETEHSRKINYETVTANNYCDNFITGIVGWNAEENECISDRYLAFESKYTYRKKDGELKSQTMKAKDFRLGFASLNNHTIEFYEDLISLLDDKIVIYFSVFSKIEYVINQLFVNYHSSLLDFGWFAVNQRQLDLYKKLYLAICENNKYWYKTFSGIYSDDLVSFVALLQFMNHFSDADEIRKSNIEMQPEYYNAFVCESLNKRYEIMRNKLPIYPILEDDKNYFYNQRGAIVYKDISNQPMLPLHSRKNEFYVLSVGFSQNGTPLVTISENDKPICYRLPEDYGEWAMNVVGMANMGEKLFPCKVVFSLIDGRYLVDIL